MEPNKWRTTSRDTRAKFVTRNLARAVRARRRADDLATTRFTDREALRFELTVEDLERGERHPLSFQKTLWAQ